MNSKTLYVTERGEWRNWLLQNHNTEDEVWLIYPKKSTGKPRIEYNTAVEEALCFGWIDSTVKSLDEKHTIQRFSVRRKNSNYSQPNRERLKCLFEMGMIHPSIVDTIRPIINEAFNFPSDIIREIKRDRVAWKHYRGFSESYKRIRIAYIDSARKRPEKFQRRLRTFIEKTQKNTLIRGFGGIEKYY